MKTIKTAVILAGGVGSRLRPVTLEMPKVLIPIKGKSLLKHVVDKVKEAGVTDVFLSLGYMSDKVIDYCDKNKSNLGVNIHFIVESKRLGTGGWMKLISNDEKEKYFSEDFIVVNGDNLFDLDWKNMINNFSGDLCIALTKVYDVSAYGVADFDGKCINRFVEKPKIHEAPSNLINSGYYLFSARVFNYIPEADRFMLEKDVFPQIAQNAKLSGYVDEGQWFDTGTFERWESVINNWKKN